MMTYSAEELWRNARILRLVTSLVMVLYILSGAAAAIGGVGLASYKGVTGSPLFVLGICLFLGYVVIGLVVLAPLRLMIEVALCLSRMEEHAAVQSAALEEMRSRSSGSTR